MTNFLNKIKQIDQELNQPLIHQQVNEITAIIQAAATKSILPKAPKKLGLLPDQYEQLAAAVGEKQEKKLKVINQLLNSLRQFLSINYGIWSLPNLETAQLLKKELRLESALEIMAGNAYWAKALAESKMTVTATDSLEWAKTSKTGQKPFYPVLNFQAAAAIKKFSGVDLILCSWAPNFTQSDLEVVSAWQKYSPSSHLVFIGEKNGATNSPDFWTREKFVNSTALKKINRSFSSYDFIDEQIYEIKHEL